MATCNANTISHQWKHTRNLLTPFIQNTVNSKTSYAYWASIDVRKGQIFRLHITWYHTHDEARPTFNWDARVSRAEIVYADVRAITIRTNALKETKQMGAVFCKQLAALCLHPNALRLHQTPLVFMNHQFSLNGTREFREYSSFAEPAARFQGSG